MPDDELDMTFDDLKRKKMITTSFDELLKIICIQNYKKMNLDDDYDYGNRMSSEDRRNICYILGVDGRITRSVLKEYKNRNPKLNSSIVNRTIEEMENGFGYYERSSKVSLFKRVSLFLGSSLAFHKEHTSFPTKPSENFECSIVGIYAWLIGIAVYPFINQIKPEYSIGGIVEQALDFDLQITLTEESLTKKYKVKILSKDDEETFMSLKNRIGEGIKQSCEKSYVQNVVDGYRSLIDTTPFFLCEERVRGMNGYVEKLPDCIKVCMDCVNSNNLVVNLERELKNIFSETFSPPVNQTTIATAKAICMTDIADFNEDIVTLVQEYVSKHEDDLKEYAEQYVYSAISDELRKAESRIKKLKKLKKNNNLIL